MAKAKSKKVTLEEALVPVEEQPYKVPENWCWTRIKHVSDVVTGSTPSKKHAEYYGGDFPFFKPADLEAGDNVVEATEYLSEEGKNVSRIIPKLSTAVCCIGSIGKTGLIRVEGTTNQQINSMIPKINPLYLYYYSKSNVFIEELWNKSTSTTISLVNKKNMETNTIPLAPLAEQKRIVEQIESLFSKLDEAKEKALSVVESFESRKIAILNNAFNGLYSTDWREKHHCTLDDWKDRKINEICIPRAGFAFNSKKFTESGIQIIRMGNLYAGKLNLSRSPVFYDISDVDDNIIKRSMVHDGDILLTLTGTKYKRDYGYAVCIEGEHELLVNQRILCLSPTEKIDKEYLLYYLRSEIFRDIFFSNETGGVNQGNVSSKFVENIEIKLPSIEEQKEISKILKNILTKEEQAKELAEVVIEQIELMKKSILDKAFRGELGTNNPEEESSSELLKSIIEGEK